MGQSASEEWGTAASRDPGGVGYLLKDRVADVSELIEAISGVVRGGTVLDPGMVSQLLGRDWNSAGADGASTVRRFTL